MGHKNKILEHRLKNKETHRLLIMLVLGNKVKLIKTTLTVSKIMMSRMLTKKQKVKLTTIKLKKQTMINAPQLSKMNKQMKRKLKIKKIKYQFQMMLKIRKVKV